MKIRRIQYGVTLCALLTALAHIIWPSLTIDAITVTLIFIALVPWLAPLFKSLELHGGWKIEFHDFERARTKADRAGLLTETPRIESERQYSFQLVAQEDPKLALAGLRIEIEKRLNEIAESNGINVEKASVGRMLRILGERELLSQEQRSVLSDMVGLLNAAVHGGEIDNRAAEWALDVGPRVVRALETKIKKI